MNIGLVDVDSHNFPNIPLMKLSAYHAREAEKAESPCGKGSGRGERNRNEAVPGTDGKI